MSLAAVALSPPPPQGLVYAKGSPLELLVLACERIARSDASVLITGETGTGKEVFARLVHRASRRAAGPFVPVNCAAIPESLRESVLFGHARGAFTGAATPRRGRIAQAAGGTLLLDEVGELPWTMQAKLLRVLQEGTVEPLGSSQAVSVDFRLVAATNRDLAAEVAAGRFRADLYYRLLVCPLELPPLRDRPGDVAPLVRDFLAALGEVREFEPRALELLTAFRWPGNVRELQNVVERISVCARGATLGADDLPADFRASTSTSNETSTATASASASANPILSVNPSSAPSLPVDLPALLRDLEESYIAAALDHAGGNKTLAADLLGLGRTTLVEKLRRRARAPNGLVPVG